MSSKRPQIKIIKNLKPVSNVPVSENRDFYYQNVQDSLAFFTSDNAPVTYEKLKKEVKILAETHAKTFVILAHRLKIIRDQELYKEDGYSDFKSFIEGELDIARTTVYNYIWILENFGVQTFEQVKTSNLIAILKPLKENPEDREKLLNKAIELSNRELHRFIKENYSYQNDKIIEEYTEEWYESEEELINNSKFVRAGMKEKTVKAILKDMTNWLLLHKPKNKKVKKMIEALKEL